MSSVIGRIIIISFIIFFFSKCISFLNNEPHTPETDEIKVTAEPTLQVTDNTTAIPTPTPTPTSSPVQAQNQNIIIKARILEYNKATRVVYINAGSSTNGIIKGIEGIIYTDRALTQKNGKVTLTKVYPSYSEGRASGLNYEIDPSSAIAVFKLGK